MLYALALVLWVFALDAVAADGVREINQACAATGCFPGDAAGFPVEITTPGSYRLTSNLDPNAVCRAIQIAATPVEVDLGGFTVGLLAGGSCAPAALDLIGVDNTSTREGASIHDGAVTGAARHGVNLGPRSAVERLHSRFNLSSGISVGEGSRVVASTAARNFGVGITGGRGVQILDSNASLNSGTGISAPSAGTVDRCTSTANGQHGFEVGSSTVTRSAARDNARQGIRAGVSTIVDNVARSNGEDGVYCSAGCVVRQNAASDNGGYGFYLDVNDPTSPYSHNTLIENTLGAVYGGANRGGNYCYGTNVVSDTCP